MIDAHAAGGVDWDLVKRLAGSGPWLLGGIAIAITAERLRPARRYERYWRRQFPFDLGAFAIMCAWSKVSDPLLRWLNALLTPMRLHTLGEVLAWPVKVIAVLMLADFLNYWIHRGMHSYGLAGKALWRTHRWHHEPTMLTALAGFRGSFLHRFLFACSYLVAGLLFDLHEVTAYAALAALNMVHDIVAHTNVDVDPGRWLWWIALPRWHRVHHSITPELQSSNFGQHFTIWDRLFGTYTDPKKLVDDFALGIDETPRNRVTTIVGL